MLCVCDLCALLLICVCWRIAAYSVQQLVVAAALAQLVAFTNVGEVQLDADRLCREEQVLPPIKGRLWHIAILAWRFF